MVASVRFQNPAQMCLARTMMWSKHSRRIDPISRSAKLFCQGEAGAIGSTALSSRADCAPWASVVRHGHLPEREVMTGIGPVAVRQPRVRDREAAAADPDRIRV